MNDLPNPVERLDVDDFVDGRLAVDAGTHRGPFVRPDNLSGIVPRRLAPGIPLGSGGYHVAPDALRGRIAEDDVSGHINNGDADWERIEHQPQEALASRQLFFRPLS